MLSYKTEGLLDPGRVTVAGEIRVTCLLNRTKKTMRLFFGEVVSLGRVDLLDQIAMENFRYHDGDHVVTSAAEMKESIAGYKVRDTLNKSVDYGGIVP